MTKLIVAVRNFANAPTNTLIDNNLLINKVGNIQVKHNEVLNYLLYICRISDYMYRPFTYLPCLL